MDIFVITLGVLALVFGLGYKFMHFNPEINKAVHTLKKDGDGLPLLKLIVDGTVRWQIPSGRRCRSLDGHLLVENDIYFYLRVDGYNTYNLCDYDMSEMLECAAINQSKLSRAVDNYTQYLELKNAVSILH